MTPIESYGLPGVLLGGIAWLAIVFKDILKDHKAERDEIERQRRIERDDFRKTIERQFEDSNKVTNNATQALTELSSLLKNRK